MNDVSEAQKSTVMKIMAIVGFVAVIVFAVWLAVQIVTLMPSAFSSLASIADGVYNYEEPKAELIVTNNETLKNAGETFTVSWDEIDVAGEYTFSYACADGVSVDVRNHTGVWETVECDEVLSLGTATFFLPIIVESERQRFADVTYTIAFTPESGDRTTLFSHNAITIVNPSIPQSNVVSEDTETEDDVEETVEPEVAGETTTNVPTQPSTPRVIETIVLETPVSNPNGFVDLAVRLTAVGHLDSNGNFSQRGNIDDDARGAFQFEVRNIGTKTSDEWDFIATLTSGTEYDAPTQIELKPQERVLFTLGYDNVGQDGIREIGVRVRVDDDINRSNNSFTWAVSVVD